MEISPDIVIDQLSEKLASLITDRLEAASLSQPLVIIDLLPDIGRRMIRKTAAILNKTRLEGRVVTHDLFGAYAADGTVEGHSAEEWEEILTSCGMNEPQRAAWKRLELF